MNQDLNNLSVGELGNLFPITIVEYDPSWKNIFISEKQNICNAIGLENIIRIEHIGSTAVPGLYAKPTIDILLEIMENLNNDLIVDKLKFIEYHFIPKPENPPPHMMFAKGYSAKGYIGQTFHIHVRFQGDWDELIFRDYLIKNPKTAKEYTELKLRLSTVYVNDREEYTDNKTEFITQITKIAREELKNKNVFL